MPNTTTRAKAPTTAREAIADAFKSLRREGYFCRMNFWCCQTCALHAIPDAKSKKYVFFTQQDARDLDRTGSCYLAWAGEGDRIFVELAGAGLLVDWNGRRESRMRVWLSQGTKKTETKKGGAR